jgi:ABC-type Na+ transport system ATPase subunit NatA
VLATENKHKSILYEEHSVHKVEMITDHIGMVYSGEYILLQLKGYILRGRKQELNSSVTSLSLTISDFC